MARNARRRLTECTGCAARNILMYVRPLWRRRRRQLLLLRLLTILLRAPPQALWLIRLLCIVHMLLRTFVANI